MSGVTQGVYEKLVTWVSKG